MPQEGADAPARTVPVGGTHREAWPADAVPAQADRSAVRGGVGAEAAVAGGVLGHQAAGIPGEDAPLPVPGVVAPGAGAHRAVARGAGAHRAVARGAAAAPGEGGRDAADRGEVALGAGAQAAPGEVARTAVAVRPVTQVGQDRIEDARAAPGGQGQDEVAALWVVSGATSAAGTARAAGC